MNKKRPFVETKRNPIVFVILIVCVIVAGGTLIGFKYWPAIKKSTDAFSHKKTVDTNMERFSASDFVPEKMKDEWFGIKPKNAKVEIEEDLPPQCSEVKSLAKGFDINGLSNEENLRIQCETVDKIKALDPVCLNGIQRLVISHYDDDCHRQKNPQAKALKKLQRSVRENLSDPGYVLDLCYRDYLLGSGNPLIEIATPAILEGPSVIPDTMPENLSPANMEWTNDDWHEDRPLH